MDEKLIELLKSTDDYISGEEISKEFGLTRASVWKHIKALKEIGYKIEGVSRKGYKLISCPDLIVPNEISSYLNTKFIGREIFYFPEISSTNDYGKTLEGKAKNGALIVSEMQVGGKGRLGRVWKSPKGGIWFSLYLTPNIEPMKASKITQVAAAALVNVLLELNINAKIKWPNDVYINNKKVTGILTEMKCEMERINYLIVGIGINANIESSDFNEDVKDTATSILIETGKKINRTELLGRFLNSFEKLYVEVVDNNNYSNVVNICRTHSLLINKQVYWIVGSKVNPVTCLDINDEGELVVRTEDGNVTNVISGEITTKLV